MRWWSDVVSDSQHNWDLTLPYVMAAYHATLHQSTGYTPNYLMFAQENRAPADLVFAIPNEFWLFQTNHSCSISHEVVKVLQKRVLGIFLRWCLNRTIIDRLRKTNSSVVGSSWRLYLSKTTSSWQYFYSSKSKSSSAKNYSSKSKNTLVVTVLFK